MPGIIGVSAINPVLLPMKNWKLCNRKRRFYAMGKFETLCNEYRENKRLIEELEAENDSLKAAIITIMGGA